MALDLSRRMFLGAAASSAAVALTANTSTSIAAETLDDTSLIPGLIPDRPKREFQPALHDAWNRMFQDPLQWVTPSLENLTVKRSRKHRTGYGSSNLISGVQPDAHQFLGTGTTRYEDSSAWSGASIVSDQSKQFVQVYGGFKVPTASVPPNGVSGKHYSATWIGLDGDRRYLDSTLPQVGTQQNTLGPNVGTMPDDLPDYYAWFQWWTPRRVKAELWWITGVPIQAGDDVMGLIWAIDPSHVVVYFRNFMTNQITTFVMAAPESFRRSGEATTYNPIVSGATAEWIVEDPSVAIDPRPGAALDPKLEPFAAYTPPVTFRNCVAGMAPAPGPATSEKVLTAPRYKRMYQVLQNPSRTRLVSMAKRGASDTELVVTYGGFG